MRVRPLTWVSPVNRNFTYNAVHVDGAERIAQIAAQTGVARLIQVSHLNASTSSGSSFYQSKAEGEEKVKAAFPTATIVRPAAMYGYEDRFLNNMARMLRCAHVNCTSLMFLYPMAVWPIWWKLNHMKTTVRPVHVRVLI